MMLLSTVLLALTAATPAPAASPKPSPKAAAQPAPAPTPHGQLANVRIEIKLTDQRGEGDPTVRHVTMIVADRRGGMSRAADAPAAAMPTPESMRPVSLNVDAKPSIEEGNRIRLFLSLEYNVQDESGRGKGYPVRGLRQNFDIVAESGKPLTLADSSDPLGDRRVAVEVTATIVR